MGKFIAILTSGTIFGFGLALSGMTHAEKVLGFLDVAGNWDPSLLPVLGGAVGVTLISFRFVLRRPTPLLEPVFVLPTKKHIDTPLIAGAVLFGIGWGISGYCPGPAIAQLAAPNWETWVFIPTFLLGALLNRVTTQQPTLQTTS